MPRRLVAVTLSFATERTRRRRGAISPSLAA
jgi:hypothetical protein